MALTGAGTLALRYRRDLRTAYSRLETVDRTTCLTDLGRVEFAERGTGWPLLVSHGIFHGCDGGLRSARDVVMDRRVIAPSRFGYLGSSMPLEATPAAQADAFVALLDHLGLERADVLGISAGTGAAVQMALRHPDRVGHLVVSSGNWPGSPTSEAPPDWARAFYSDPAMWSMKALAPPMMRRLMGVPLGFPQDADQAREIADMVASVFPIKPRLDGAIFDAFTSNPEINNYPLEDVGVPTLILHAEDDPLASHEAASRAAKRIAGAVMISLDSGGHLGLGQTVRVRSEIDAFLKRPPPDPFHRPRQRMREEI